MMLRGAILESVEEYAYFVNLLPYEVMDMTVGEIKKVYYQRMERIKYDNKANDVRTGRICAVLANIHRDPKKHRKPFSEMDFVPKSEKEKKKEQSIETMAAILEAVTKANNGTVVR